MRQSLVPPSTPSALNWRVRTWLPVCSAALLFGVGLVGARSLGWRNEITVSLYALVYLIVGYEPVKGSLKDLRQKRVGTDMLMIAGAIGAAALGRWPEGALLLILFALGHAGERLAMARAKDAIESLGQLMPRIAHRKRGWKIEAVAVESLAVGDTVLVRPGDRVPVDGIVIAGQSDLDQSVITGESVPVARESGDEVFAGTVNLESALDVKVTRIADDNTLSRIMRLVTEAQGEKSRVQRFADRVVYRVAPLVLGFAFLIALFPPLMADASWETSLHRAILVILAASPCALAIGAPAAVLAGVARAARQGVLIKGGAHLETLGALQIIALDKTGTLTTGKFGVMDLRPFHGQTREELLRVAAAIESQSNHPLAAAIVKFAKSENITLANASSVENLPGRGIKAVVDHSTVIAGTLRAFQDLPDGDDLKAAQACVAEFESKGLTVVLVRKDARFLGAIGLADVKRFGIEDVISRLRKLGVRRILMLTGDNSAVAQRIALGAGINEVHAAQLPEDKLAVIESLAQHGPVAMVGDGVNDAPALAAATVGIAMGGGGAAVALDAADVALTGDDLAKLPFAIELGRASRAIVQQNLLIALGTIAVLLIASFSGAIGLATTVAFHEGSTVLVVINALRLLRFKALPEHSPNLLPPQ